jgi:hypothetical protein
MCEHNAASLSPFFSPFSREIFAAFFLHFDILFRVVCLPACSLARCNAQLFYASNGSLLPAASSQIARGTVKKTGWQMNDRHPMPSYSTATIITTPKREREI